MGALFQVDEIEPLVAGLVGGIDVDGGPTGEQETVLGSILSNLLKRSDLKLSEVTPLSPGEAAALMRPDARLRFCEILTTLELCRHPQSREPGERGRGLRVGYGSQAGRVPGHP